MPTADEAARGGVIRYRTLKLAGGRYLRLSIVPKPGPRAGRTLAGPLRRRRSLNTSTKGGPGNG